MNIRKYYIQHVIPSLRRFIQGYEVREIGLLHDLERGAVVAEYLLNLSDFVFSDSACKGLSDVYRNAREYREQKAWKVEPLYEICCDLANAWKHHTISRDRRTIHNLGDVLEICAICRYLDTAGTYYCTEKFTMLQMTNGMRADLRRIVVASARFWAKQLTELNILHETPSTLLEFSEFVSRDDADSELPLIIHGVVGEPMHIQMRCFDFDPHRQILVDAKPDTGFDGLGNVKILIHTDYSDAPSSLRLF